MTQLVNLIDSLIKNWGGLGDLIAAQRDHALLLEIAAFGPQAPAPVNSSSCSFDGAYAASVAASEAEQVD